MLKLGWTSPNLAKIWLNKSTVTKFYRLTEADKYRLGKIGEDVFGGIFIALHAKQLLMRLFFESLQTYANQ